MFNDAPYTTITNPFQGLFSEPASPRKEGLSVVSPSNRQQIVKIHTQTCS